MIDYFYKFRQPIGCNKLKAGINKGLEVSLNFLYPIYLKYAKFESGVNVTQKREEEIIISLTSFPARLDKLHICISSLLKQTLKPDRIILWLYSGECTKEDIPNELLEMEKYGLEIAFCEENLKPHKKYYYTAKENPNSVIITVDDDNYYPSWLVEELYKAHLRDRDNVICTVSRKIAIMENGEIGKYSTWDKMKIEGEDISHLRIAIGCGGVLYPANCMDEEYFDISKIKNLSLDTDDLWAKFAELRANRKVHVIKNNEFYPISLRNSQKTSLKSENVGENRNDANMKKLTNEFKTHICKMVLE